MENNGSVQVSPAYGARYKYGSEARAAWEEGKDFIIEDVVNPWCGKPTSIRDGWKHVEIRFGVLKSHTTTWNRKGD